MYALSKLSLNNIAEDDIYIYICAYRCHLHYEDIPYIKWDDKKCYGSHILLCTIETEM